VPDALSESRTEDLRSLQRKEERTRRRLHRIRALLVWQQAGAWSDAMPELHRDDG
jgi:uncharacterized protein YheU (UPF0270 family)